MRRLLKFTVLTASGLLLAWAPLCFAKPRLDIVTEAWPPYVIDAGQGQISGFDYEVSKQVLERLGYQVNVSFVPWKRALVLAQAGNTDGILDIYYLADRLSYLFYPDEPLSTGGETFFFLRNRPFAYTGIASLTGKTVGTQAGYNYSEEFNQASNFTKVPLTGNNSVEKNLKMLQLGRVDLVIANKAVGLYSADKMGIREQIGYTENMLSQDKLNFLAFTHRPGHEALAREFSNALKAFKQTDAYRQIMSKYGQ